MTAIEQDGQDPSYLANLTALGAVIVPKSPTLFRPVSSRSLRLDRIGLD